MALNFPTNPTDGQTYEGYVYDATAGVWNSDPHQIASRFVTSATSPSSPSEGDGWFDTNTAKSYVYYDGVWVQLGALGTVDLNQIADVNVSSPANGESLVYDGTDWVNQNVTVEPTEIYDVSTTSVGKFALPAGTSSERPVAPNAGDIRFNTDIGEPEYYNSNVGDWLLFRSAPTFIFDYLVHGGGGGATGGVSGVNYGSGGAAAVAREGYRLISDTFTVTVGAGGAGNGGAGSPSTFESVTATGGYSVGTGFLGGSNQDYTAILYQSGVDAGGGVGAAGTNSQGNGGPGFISSITGTAIQRGGGGAGGLNGQPGAGGGGSFNGGPGQQNTGSGAAGASAGGAGSSTGGSGIVIIKYPSAVVLNIDPGLVSSTDQESVPGYKITTFTSGTGLVSIA